MDRSLGMEKSGALVLTEDDMAQYREGKVSERITALWQLRIEELRQVVEDENYTIIDKEIDEHGQNK